MLSLKETAEVLGVSARTLYKWAGAGTIPAYKLGRVYRFNRAELDGWLQKCKNTCDDRGLAGS